MKTINNQKRFSWLRALVSLTIVTSLFMTSCKEEESNTPAVVPTSSFTFVANELEVTFTNTSENATTYMWSFDKKDATAVSTDMSPVYTYAAAGTYTVKLTAIDGAGHVHSSTKEVTVSKTAVAPVAGFTSVVADLKVTFTNTTTGGMSYSWDFGDGSGTSTDAAPEYTYAAEGTYTVKLTAKGEGDLMNEFSADVVVVAPVVILPVANFTTAVEDLKVTFTNTSTDATSYSWDFGDGSGTSTDASPMYTYAAAGDYDVKLVATDDNAQTSEKMMTVTVTAATTGGGTVAFINGTFDDIDASGETDTTSDAYKALRDANNDDWVVPAELEAWIKANVANSTVMAGMTTSKNNGAFALKFDAVQRRAYQKIAVTAGKTYTIKFWARVDGAADANTYFDFYVLAADIADETTLASNLAKLELTGTDGSYVEQTIIFTATTSEAVFYARGFNSTNKGYLDDVTIVENK